MFIRVYVFRSIQAMLVIPPVYTTAQNFVCLFGKKLVNWKPFLMRTFFFHVPKFS